MGLLKHCAWVFLFLGISAAVSSAFVLPATNAAEPYGWAIPSPADGNGTFRGYVRTSLLPGGIVQDKGDCRVLVLNAGAPGLLVGHPVSSTDTVKGPAVLYVDYSTPSSGYYEISLPPGEYKVIFWAAGFVPRTYGLHIKPGMNEPVFSYYEKDKRPIRPGTGIDPWQGGPTHDFLSFDGTVQRAATSPPHQETPSQVPGEFRISGQTYTDLKYGFALDAPAADWIVRGGAAAAGEVKNARAYLVNTGKTAALSLMAGTNPNQASPERVLDVISGAMGDHDVVERKNVTIGPYPGMMQAQISRPANSEEPKIYYLVAVFGDEGFICVITGWTAAIFKDDHIPEFHRILESFRRIDPGTHRKAPDYGHANGDGSRRKR